MLTPPQAVVVATNAHPGPGDVSVQTSTYFILTLAFLNNLDGTPAQQFDPIQGPVDKAQDGSTQADQNNGAGAANNNPPPTVTVVSLTGVEATSSRAATATATTTAAAAKPTSNASAFKISAIALVGMASAWLLF